LLHTVGKVLGSLSTGGKAIEPINALGNSEESSSNSLEFHGCSSESSDKLSWPDVVPSLDSRPVTAQRDIKVRMGNRDGALCRALQRPKKLWC